MPKFWWTVLVRALSDSVDFIGQTTTALGFGVLVLLLTVAWLLWKHGWREAMNQWVQTSAEGIVIAIIAFILVTIVHFIYAPYHMLNDERAKVQQAQKDKESAERKLVELTQPRFRTDMVVMIAPAGKIGEKTLVTLSGTIKNTGAPSMVDGWKVSMKLQNGRIVWGELLVPPQLGKDVRLMNGNRGDTNQSGVLLYSDQHWYRTTVNPIPTNGGAPGWLMVLMPIPFTEANRPDNVTKLEVSDVHGTWWPSEDKQTGRFGPPPSMYDIQQP